MRLIIPIFKARRNCANRLSLEAYAPSQGHEGKDAGADHGEDRDRDDIQDVADERRQHEKHDEGSDGDADLETARAACRVAVERADQRGEGQTEQDAEQDEADLGLPHAGPPCAPTLFARCLRPIVQGMPSRRGNAPGAPLRTSEAAAATN